MLRKTLAVLLVLLILAGAAAAHDSPWYRYDHDHQPKEIPHYLEMSVTCSIPWVSIGWYSPEKKPHSYRISWTHSKRWRSLKKPNTETAGNMILPGHKSYWPSGTGFPYRTDRTLRFRVRAIYRGEPNGPWNQRTLIPPC